MDADPRVDGDGADQPDADLSIEALLEALMVDDAATTWDPVTGRPIVSRRPKFTLDRPLESAYDRA